jgi:hypothetical protein
MSETNFVAIFPLPELTPLSNQTPNQATLRLVHHEINANAIAVPLTRGNGILGHYKSVVDDATYSAAAGADTAGEACVFVPLVHPGDTPEIGATAAAITEANRRFLADSKEYALYVNTDTASKKLLLKAVPIGFTQKLKDPLLGFATVTTLQFLQHLDTTYGIVTEDDLDRNLTEISK